jgi:hypothetical protein
LAVDEADGAGAVAGVAAAAAAGIAAGADAGFAADVGAAVVALSVDLLAAVLLTGFERVTALSNVPMPLP